MKIHVMTDEDVVIQVFKLGDYDLSKPLMSAVLWAEIKSLIQQRLKLEASKYGNKED